MAVLWIIFKKFTATCNSVAHVLLVVNEGTVSLWTFGWTYFGVKPYGIKNLWDAIYPLTPNCTAKTNYQIMVKVDILFCNKCANITEQPFYLEQWHFDSCLWMLLLAPVSVITKKMNYIWDGNVSQTPYIKQ